MDMIELLNKIRSEASDLYKARVPEATAENMESIRYAMLSEDNVQVANEFMKTLLNKFIKAIVHEKMFKNPLHSLKKGNIPLGDTIEEIYTNFIKADQDAFNGEKLFQRNLPDTKTVYHRKNYEPQYEVTVNRTKLAAAFTSYPALDNYVSGVIKKLYDSAELDEFLNMKQLFKSAYDHNAIKVITVKDPLKNKENAEEFITTVKTISGLMKYPSANYNSYRTAQNEDPTDLLTFSRYDEQVLILPEAVNTKVDVSVLANTFNMTLAEFNKTRKILVDELPIKNCVGALIDEQFLQVHDNYYIVTEFFNPKGLYTNYYLSIGQTLAYSILVNGILFIAEDDADGDGTVETFSVTNNLAEGITTTNSRTEVNEGSSYTATLKGEVTSCTVKMGGADVSATVYNSETKKISIAEVTGNIEITVA